MTEQVFNNNQYPPIGNFAVGTVTASLGSVQFSNSNGVSFGMNSNGVVTASVAAAGGGVALVDSGGNSISSGTAVFSNANGVTFGINGQTITASVAAGAGAAISAAGASQNAGTIVFSNSNNVSFGMNGSTVTGAFRLNVSANGGTSNALSGLTFANSNGVTFGLSTGAGVGTLTASVANTVGFNISGGAGTSNSGVSGITFQNSNGLSFGVSTGANVVSVTGSYSVPNLQISGGAGTSNASVTGITFQNSNGVTFGVSTGANAVSITASVGNTFSYSNLAVAGGLSVSTNGISATISDIAVTRLIWPAAQMVVVAPPGNGSLSIQYVPVYQPITGTRIDALVFWQGSSTASAVTMGIAMSAWAIIYTRNVSTLSSLSSGSTQTTYTYASNSAGNTQLQNFGMRPISVPVNFNLTQGEYFVGFNFSTTATSIGAATTNLGQTLSIMGAVAIQTLQVPYAEFTANTATSTNLYGGMGVYTAATAGAPVSINLNAINQTGTSLAQANIALVFRNG